MRVGTHRYYNQLHQSGVNVSVHFSSIGFPSKYGAWGLLESSDQDPDTAVKQKGLFGYMDQHSVCVLPNATCSGRSGSRCSGHGMCLEDGGCFCFYQYRGDTCSEASYAEYKGDCGYQCTFDQGVCQPFETVGLDR